MKEMRSFSIESTNGFRFVTGWLDDTKEAFEKLREETKKKAEEYLTFIQGFIPSKGLHIEYYHLDSDDFGDASSIDDVVIWAITFTEKDEEGITESLSGIEKREYYQVIDVESKKTLFVGEWHQCSTYIDTHHPVFDESIFIDFSHEAYHLTL